MGATTDAQARTVLAIAADIRSNVQRYWDREISDEVFHARQRELWDEAQATGQNDAVGEWLWKNPPPVTDPVNPVDPNDTTRAPIPVGFVLQEIRGYGFVFENTISARLTLNVGDEVNCVSHPNASKWDWTLIDDDGRVVGYSNGQSTLAAAVEEGQRFASFAAANLPNGWTRQDTGGNVIAFERCVEGQGLTLVVGDGQSCESSGRDNVWSWSLVDEHGCAHNSEVFTPTTLAEAIRLVEQALTVHLSQKGGAS